MDERRFDELTQVVAGGLSRRGIACALAALPLAAGLAALLGDEGKAQNGAGIGGRHHRRRRHAHSDHGDRKAKRQRRRKHEGRGGGGRGGPRCGVC